MERGPEKKRESKKPEVFGAADRKALKAGALATALSTLVATGEGILIQYPQQETNEAKIAEYLERGTLAQKTVALIVQAEPGKDRIDACSDNVALYIKDEPDLMAKAEKIKELIDAAGGMTVVDEDTRTLLLSAYVTAIGHAKQQGHPPKQERGPQIASLE